MATMGSWTLILSLVVATYGALAALVAARRRSALLTESAEKALWIVAGLGTAACAVLLYALLSHQFQILYVYRYTSTHLPPLYRVSALWAGEAGSLLLWFWLLAIVAFIAVQRRDRTDPARPYLVFTLLACEAFFALVLLVTSNPFSVFPMTPEEGIGMLPLLQNVGMVLHPPVLFLGYAAYTIPFASAFATLCSGSLTSDWLARTRRWSLFAWTTLGAGILIGAWWSYVELGWGGFWAWDPVENASLIPWLVGTALLHSTILEERRGRYRRWNFILSALAFTLCLLATLVTRGGIIVSDLHGFSSTVQPIAFYLIAAIAVCLVATLILVARRSRQLAEPASEVGLVSRESGFLLANVLLCGAAVVVLLGTAYPSLVRWIRGAMVSLGSPFFDRAVNPLLLLVVLLMGVCPLLGWGRSARTTAKRLLLPAALGISVVVVLVLLRIRDPFPLVSAFVCAFVATSLLGVIARDVAASCRKSGSISRWPGAIAAQCRRSHRRYGAHLVHLSIVLIAIGITGSTAYKSEVLVSLTPGESTQFHGYDLTYEGFSVDTLDDRPVTYQSRVRYEAALSVFRNGSRVTILRPEKNYHWALESPWVTEVAISSSLREDLYVILASLSEDGRAGFQLVVNPLINWLWIGGGLLLAGALLAGWTTGRGKMEERIDV